MSASILTALVALLAQSPRAPVFPVGVETVYVDAFVTRGEAALTGLTAANFELLDDGVRQPLRLVDQRSTGVSAVLVLDVSGSVEGPRLEHLQAACRAFVNDLGPLDEAALLSVSHRLQLLVPATADRERLRAAVGRLRAGGATALNDALYAALRLEHGERRPLVVVFSDGRDNLSWLRPEDVLRAAEVAPALIYAVGLDQLPPNGGNSPSQEPELPAGMQFLRRLAESSGGRLWRAERPEALAEAFLRVLRETRERYLLAYEPPAKLRPGYHRLDVRLRGVKGRVRVRPGYRVPDRAPAGATTPHG